MSAVLGPWVNKPVAHVLATIILAILVVLSLILVFSTIFSGVSVTLLLIIFGSILVVRA